MLLYHYTSIESLFAIINGITINEEEALFSLRATHARFLNDMTEGRLVPLALEKLGVSKEELLRLEFIQGYPFLVSLSSQKDNLNMWRCYASQGAGVSIGMDSDEINASLDNSSFRLEECIYSSIDQIINELQKENIEKAINSQDRLLLDRILSNTMLKYKDDSFKDEYEWRILGFDTESGFRLSGNMVIPYKDIKLPLSVIKNITFGPKCIDINKVSFSILRMLKSKGGNNIEILQSQIPLV